MAEQFGIEVKIEPKVDEGARKVDTALAGLEKHAKETGDAIAKAIGAGVRDATSAVVAEMRKERDALTEVTRAAKESEAAERARARALHEEAEWENALTKAQRDHAAATKLIIDEARKSIDVAKESKSAWGGALGRWKEIARGVGDVGNALNTVRQGIEMVKIGFETSKKVAAEAIAVWRSMDNSGPSAYVGRDVRQSARLRKASDRLGGTYTSTDSLPAEIRKFAEDTSLPESDFEEAIGNYIRVHKVALDEATKKFQQANQEAAERAQRWRDENPDGLKQDLDPTASRLIGGAERGRRRKERAAARKGDGGEASAERNQLLEEEARVIGILTEGLYALYDGYYEASAVAEEFFAATEKVVATREYLAESAVGVTGLGAQGFQPFKEATSDALKFAEAIAGPVGDAINGLIDGLVSWKMEWGDWARSAVAAIAKVMIQLLALQAIEAIAGAGGGSSKLGQLLWGAFGGSSNARTAGGGGGSSERRVVRHAYGDPFGGGGGTSGAIWRAPVMAPQSPGGGAGGGGGSSKVIVVADMRAAALEAMKSPEGERVTIANVDKHRGKLGGR